VANRYTLELQALAATLTTPAGPDAGESPAVLTFDQAAAELLLALERDLEPRLAADTGDLAHLAGWAAKLAGATCRLAGLLHLAGICVTAGPGRSTPTPSPAPPAWPATWSTTPARPSI
jgi:replicative DNA helicase